MSGPHDDPWATALNEPKLEKPWMPQRGDIVEVVNTQPSINCFNHLRRRFIVMGLTPWSDQLELNDGFSASRTHFKLISRPTDHGWHKHDQSSINPVPDLKVQTAFGFPPAPSMAFDWSKVQAFAVVDCDGKIIAPTPDIIGPSPMTPPTQYFDGSTLKLHDKVTVELSVGVANSLDEHVAHITVASERGNQMVIDVSEIRTHKGNPVQHKPLTPKIGDMVKWDIRTDLGTIIEQGGGKLEMIREGWACVWVPRKLQWKTVPLKALTVTVED